MTIAAHSPASAVAAARGSVGSCGITIEPPDVSNAPAEFSDTTRTQAFRAVPTRQLTELSATNGRVHISLNLALTQGTVVNANFVELASKPFAPHRVATES